MSFREQTVWYPTFQHHNGDPWLLYINCYPKIGVEDDNDDEACGADDAV